MVKILSFFLNKNRGNHLSSAEHYYERVFLNNPHFLNDYYMHICTTQHYIWLYCTCMVIIYLCDNLYLYIIFYWPYYMIHFNYAQHMFSTSILQVDFLLFLMKKKILRQVKPCFCGFYMRGHQHFEGVAGRFYWNLKSNTKNTKNTCLISVEIDL